MLKDYPRSWIGVLAVLALSSLMWVRAAAPVAGPEYSKGAIVITALPAK